VGNDTGSSTQSISAADWQFIASGVIYTGPLISFVMSTANGSVPRQSVQLETRVLGMDLNALTPWFLAWTIIIPSAAGVATILLSGAEMRAHLFFATPKGNNMLAVGTSKQACVSRLPAVP